MPSSLVLLSSIRQNAWAHHTFQNNMHPCFYLYAVAGSQGTWGLSQGTWGTITHIHTLQSYSLRRMCLDRRKPGPRGNPWSLEITCKHGAHRAEARIKPPTPEMQGKCAKPLDPAMQSRNLSITPSWTSVLSQVHFRRFFQRRTISLCHSNGWFVTLNVQGMHANHYLLLSNILFLIPGCIFVTRITNVNGLELLSTSTIWPIDLFFLCGIELYLNATICLAKSVIASSTLVIKSSHIAN